MLRYHPNRSFPAGARLMNGPDSSAAGRDGPPVPPDAAGPASKSRATIEVEACPGITTIVVTGELDLVTMPFLAAQLAVATRDDPARLVFDLGGTHFIDCGSARLIASAGRWLPGRARPVIRRPGPGVRRVFELTGLDAHCEIEPLVVGRIRTRPFTEAKEHSGVGR
jgi:anti-anti-sigma factor